LSLEKFGITDTDISTLNTELETVEADFEKIEFQKKNRLPQHQKGYIDDNELDQKMEEVLANKAELEEEKTKCEKALNQREDVELAVEQAVNFVQDKSI